MPFVLVSPYLDKSINAARSEFEFLDLPVAGDSSPAGESEIVDTAVRFIKDYLCEDLGRIDEEKRSQIDRLVQSKSPQYRMLLNKHPDVYDEIPTGLSDDLLDLELHNHQQKWELDVARRGQDIKRRAKRTCIARLRSSRREGNARVALNGISLCVRYVSLRMACFGAEHDAEPVSGASPMKICVADRFSAGAEADVLVRAGVDKVSGSIAANVDRACEELFPTHNAYDFLRCPGS